MSKTRFYQFTYPGGGPVWLEDVGQRLKIAGLVLQGEGATIMVFAPNATPTNIVIDATQPDLATWGELLRRSDDPLIFEQDDTGMIKAIHRKVRFAISGAVQQKIWVRDGLQCLYCGRQMGEIQLTVDHFIPLELGGANNERNYVSCCRRCNKDKGSQPPADWCLKNGYDLTGLELYLAGKAPLSFISHLS